MADPAKPYPQHREAPSALETRVLGERAIGLSDLEIAARLMLTERTVRAIVCKHRREALQGLSPESRRFA